MPLDTLRVVDLTTEYGMLCAQILADLGADVIQVEPPGGAAGRQVGPFHGDVVDPERSLAWWAYARGKRSMVLDLESEHGRQTLRRLIAAADVLVESEPVGRLDALGFDDAALESINPALIHVSMTGFGRTGPKAHWAWSDLITVAAGGPLAITGDADRPPVRVSVPQGFLHAAAEAAAGTMVALYERARSGRGQRVDVSAQQAVTIATQGNVVAEAVGDTQAERAAGGIRAGDIRIRLTWPARDGFVSITHVFGATMGPATRRLMEYVYDEGFCDAATRDKDWIGYGLMLADGREPIAEFERVKDCISACTASKTKAELLEAAMQRRLLLAPVASIADAVDGPQLTAREYLVRPLGDGPAASVRYPGRFARFSATPLRRTRRPPAIGEHTAEVLAELERLTPVAERVRREAIGWGAGADPARPLQGIRILDFMWAIAGPGATKYLADFGATVIRIETASRPDACRTVRPFVNGEENPDQSALFHTLNVGKKMLTIDLTNEASRGLVHDLVRWADVVCESFSPRAMKSFGYDYESLRRLRPDLIMLSTCLMGQTGPLAAFAGYGNLSAAISGFFDLTGWPDRPPAGPYGAYTDYIAPRYNAIAILDALEHRRRTGEGQYIDMAQAEAAMHFLAPAVLEYTANGRVPVRRGNRDFHMAPHGVYPAAGEDRWVAIACRDDRDWQSLASTVDTLQPLAARFAQREERLAAVEALDARLADWTRTRDAETIEQTLQSAGIPASVVQNSRELVRDPQLAHLGHFIRLPHPDGGETVVESCRTHLSRTPAQCEGSAATLGRDTYEVLTTILGYSDEQFAELLVTGALE
ncbi:MAG TPA: CoA transferase [Pseudomonadales bacterium]